MFLRSKGKKFTKYFAMNNDAADQGDWEKVVFWGAWVLALGHALWRSAPVVSGEISPAWREQCWLIALLAVAAVALNWMTTGDHLGKTLFNYWPVAGVDLSLIACAAVSALAARELRSREHMSALNRNNSLTEDTVEVAHG